MVQRRGGESYSRDRVAGDRIVGSQVTGYNRVTSDRMIGSQVTMVPYVLCLLCFQLFLPFYIISWTSLFLLTEFPRYVASIAQTRHVIHGSSGKTNREFLLKASKTIRQRYLNLFLVYGLKSFDI